MPAIVSVRDGIKTRVGAGFIYLFRTAAVHPGSQLNNFFTLFLNPCGKNTDQSRFAKSVSFGEGSHYRSKSVRSFFIRVFGHGRKALI